MEASVYMVLVDIILGIIEFYETLQAQRLCRLTGEKICKFYSLQIISNEDLRPLLAQKKARNDVIVLFLLQPCYL